MDCLEVYGDPENLREKALFWGKMQTPIEDVMEELCQTFWNVTEYYKELPMYRDYVYELADTVDRWYPETDTKTAAKLMHGDVIPGKNISRDLHALMDWHRESWQQRYSQIVSVMIWEN